MREFTLLCAPNSTAYRRFEPHFSPGMMVAWSYDNRSAGVLAGGLYGLENKLKAPPPVLRDVYLDKSLDTAAMTMSEAIELFEASAVAEEFFGEKFVRFYAHGKKAELSAFTAATDGQDVSDVTGWDRIRYMESC